MYPLIFSKFLFVLIYTDIFYWMEIVQLFSWIKYIKLKLLNYVLLFLYTMLHISKYSKHLLNLHNFLHVIRGDMYYHFKVIKLNAFYLYINICLLMSSYICQILPSLFFSSISPINIVTFCSMKWTRVTLSSYSFM